MLSFRPVVAESICGYVALHRIKTKYLNKTLPITHRWTKHSWGDWRSSLVSIELLQPVPAQSLSKNTRDTDNTHLASLSQYENDPSAPQVKKVLRLLKQTPFTLREVAIIKHYRVNTILRITVPVNVLSTASTSDAKKKVISVQALIHDIPVASKDKVPRCICESEWFSRSLTCLPSSFK